jgi:NAD(P)-dependent dehydrogenase (short-subunit alcohol dehydrogenase family)
VALVTGAGQGIGQAIALALAERGALMIATDLAPPRETASQMSPTSRALQLPALCLYTVRESRMVVDEKHRCIVWQP